MSRLFESAYAAIQSFAAKWTPPVSMNKQELDILLNILYYDCPELIYFKESPQYTHPSEDPNEVLSIDLAYNMTQQEAVLAQQKMDALVQKFIQETRGMSDFEKELYIHDWLVKNCNYKLEGKLVTSAYGALFEGEAQCQGYSKAMCYLLRSLGVETLCVGGTTVDATGQTGEHMWNLVCIDGDWAHLDATWNDPMGSEAPENHAYFNVSDDLIGASHTLDDWTQQFDLPQCTSMRYAYAVQKGSYVDDTTDETVTALLTELFDDRGQLLEMQFATRAQYDAFVADPMRVMNVAAEKANVYPQDIRWYCDPMANVFSIYSLRYP